MSEQEVVLRMAERNDFDPVIGEMTTGLGEHLVSSGKLESDDAYARVRTDALEIVRRCQPFGSVDNVRTGLVVGHVQSGKTMSMMAVSALARDNGCRVIILFAGVTTNLLTQSAGRFRRDLRAAAGGRQTWRILDSEALKKPARIRTQLEAAISEWNDPSIPEDEKQTFFFVVLKHYKHLERIRKALPVDLRGVPILIFDDEADQASLNNNVNSGDASATYDAISALRAVIPQHTYLQYTATPQAPLLIELDDLLSPDFALLVRHGDGYTGGMKFFGAETGRFVKQIPECDLFKAGEAPETPPDSLLEALRFFFVGSAVAHLRRTPSPRSMLIHPSQSIGDHEKYRSWVSEIARRWREELEDPSDPDWADSLSEFRTAYDELASGSDDVPEFADVASAMRITIRRVEITLVNGNGSEVEWENSETQILIGGQKLNRGYTVEGLTVTYMPRNAGGWNADTLQQRARFFGYKQGYLDLCRIYLHPDVICAFRDYINHEEDVRGRLAQHQGRPLRDWRRAFILDASLKPTRRSVLSSPYFRSRTTDNWFVQQRAGLKPLSVETNLARVAELERELGLQSDRTKTQEGFAPLERILSWLGEFEVAPGESGFSAKLLQLSLLSDQRPHEVKVVFMKGDRKRTAPNGEFRLTQGEGSTGKFAGDRSFVDDARITLQIYKLQIEGFHDDFRAIAIHVPSSLAEADLLFQD